MPFAAAACDDRSWRRRAHAAIPGGCQTYAKGDDQYPANAPARLVRGDGARVWDAAGREFIEYGSGLRSTVLGHARAEVVEAAVAAMQAGVNFVRPAAIELDYAERFLAHFPAGSMVKFAKNGSDVVTAATRLARAATGRDLIAYCGDQPFFSTDDWFIGRTAMARGVPQAIRDLSVSFPYGDLVALEALFDSHDGRIACVVMEAATIAEPPPGYLQGVQSMCRRRGALFVLDEMITGFRWATGGAQKYYGIEPDLSCFGKGMANGFALAALVGRREFMALGGLNHDGERTFLLSTTNGGETHALAAAAATLGIFETEPVIATLEARGALLAEGATAAARRRGVADFFQVVGRPSNLIFVTRGPDGERSQALRTLFMQEMVRRGVLAPSFVVGAAHGEADVQATIAAVDEALAVYAAALSDRVDRFLEGPSVQPVFRRFNERP